MGTAEARADRCATTIGARERLTRTAAASARAASARTDIVGTARRAVNIRATGEDSDRAGAAKAATGEAEARRTSVFAGALSCRCGIVSEAAPRTAIASSKGAGTVLKLARPKTSRNSANAGAAIKGHWPKREARRWAARRGATEGVSMTGAEIGDEGATGCAWCAPECARSTRRAGALPVGAAKVRASGERVFWGGCGPRRGRRPTRARAAWAAARARCRCAENCDADSSRATNARTADTKADVPARAPRPARRLRHQTARSKEARERRNRRAQKIGSSRTREDKEQTPPKLQGCLS